MKARDASTSLSMTELHLSRQITVTRERSVLNQTAFAEIAEITARGALHKVDGKLEQANFPRVVYSLDNRAERFVFVFDLPPGAIDYRVDGVAERLFV